MEAKFLKKHWYEYRTDKGYWSKTKYNYKEEILNSEEYRRFDEVGIWKGDRVSRERTSAGYLVARLTSISPDGKCRAVYEFKEVN